MKYNIYAGLGGGFGGASLIKTEEFGSKEEAIEYARDCAVDEYYSYDGMHGLLNIDSILEDCESFGMTTEDFEEMDESDRERWAEEVLEEDIESWIDYYAIPTDEDDREVEYGTRYN